MFYYQHILMHVALISLTLSIVTAQSHQNLSSQSQSAITTSLIFVPWDADISLLGADNTATTYVENNQVSSRNNSDPKECNAEAYDRATFVNGPSTAAVTFIYTECGTNSALSYQIDCPMTAPDTATCTYIFSKGNATGTSTVTQNSSELSPQPCTITAGIEKLGIGSVMASTTSEESQPVPKATTPTPTSSTGPAQSSASSTPSAGSCSIVPSGKLFVIAAVASVFLASL